jgi:CRISPR-associated protein Cas1
MSEELKQSSVLAADPDQAIDSASARAKPLPLRLPIAPAEDEGTKGLIPARMINEVLYCERLL